MIKNALKNIKENIRKMKGYIPPPFECSIKLNQNENPFSLPIEFKREAALEFEKMEWGRYPESDAAELRQGLSNHAGFPAEGILTGNGSNELLQALMLATLSRDDTLVLASPTFTLYKHIGTILEARIVEVPLKKDFTYDVDALSRAIKREKPKLTILASPNNPTGSSLHLEEIEFLAKCSSGIVAIDEAYIEFAPNPKGCLHLIHACPSLIVTRTYSKAMSAAGLRLGYLMADPAVSYEIDKVRLPYTLGRFSRYAAMKLLEAADILSSQIQEIIRQREWLYKELRSIPAIQVYPSDANFLLIESIVQPVKDMYKQLYARGILVRDISSYPMLSRALRVSIGTEEENRRFLAALREITAHCQPQ